MDHTKIDHSDLTFPRRELSNEGLGIIVCVCVSGLTVGLRLLYFGGVIRAPSTPHY